VRVRVKTSGHHFPAIVSGSKGAQKDLRFNFINLGRVGYVLADDDLADDALVAAEQETTAFVRQVANAVRHNGVALLASQGEHASTLPSGQPHFGPTRYDAGVARAKRMQERRAAAKADNQGDRVVATNRRARHDYEIVDTFECGMVLSGSEVKSLREGRAQIGDGYGRVEDGELWLFGTHIPPWSYAVGFGSHDPDRRRKLLVHRWEIDELKEQTTQQPLTIVPLKMYFKDGRAKIEIGLARGRKAHDRRQELAKKDAEREMARVRRNIEKLG